MTPLARLRTVPQRIRGGWLARAAERALAEQFEAQTRWIAETKRSPHKRKGGRLKSRWSAPAPVVADPADLAAIGPGDQADPPQDHWPPAPFKGPAPIPPPARMPDSEPTLAERTP